MMAWRARHDERRAVVGMTGMATFVGESLDRGESGAGRVLTGPVDHLMGHVDDDAPALRCYLLRGEQQNDDGAGPDGDAVEDGYAGGDPAVGADADGAARSDPVLAGMDPRDVRVRFCPSPTGNPHVGVIRTALFNWLFARTRKKVKGKLEKYGVAGLILFVAVPLPVTGAWTGCAAAHVFGIPLRKALPAVMLGILMAGVVVTLACKLGFAVGLFFRQI